LTGVAGAALIGCGDEDANGQGPGDSTATQPATPEGDPVAGGELRVATLGDVRAMDPAFSLSSAESALAQHLYDNLVVIQHDGTLKMGLAESLEPNADLTEYIATLRPGVKFHHGKDLVAEDVVYTFDRVMDPDVGSPGSAGLTSIESVEAVDDLSVRFVLKAPDAFLPDALAIYQARITPSDVDPERLANEEFGTGPFRVTEHRAAERTVFERSPDYWDNPLPYADSMTWFYMPEPVTRLEALKTGTVDVLYPLDAAQIASATDGNLVVSEQASGTYLNTAMRVDRAPFDDIRVRRAIQAITDRELIREAANYGRGELGRDHPIASFDPHYWEDAVPPPYDPAEAAKLLDGAGFGNGLDVTLHAATFPGQVELALAYRELGAPIGLNIEVFRSPEDGYWTDIWLTEPFTTVSWQGRTVDQALSLIYLSDAPWNESYYVNEDLDAMLARARGLADLEERREVYGQVQQILIDDVPRTIPTFMPIFLGLGANVRGVAAHSSNWLFLHSGWKEA
jgi:peptide/nickel transport system substrate-binding protein